MPALFGTDGIRGEFGKYPITEQFFSSFACAAEQFFQKFLKKSSLKIAIGRDTRESGELLQNALIDSLSADTCVLDCGVLPTPGLAIVVNNQHCDLGFAITASHNPYTDNGLKIFNSNGEKLSIEIEQKLEQFFLTQPKIQPSKKCAHLVDYQKDANKVFVERFKNFSFKIEHPIILDTANGATTYTSPKILRKCCLNLEIIGNLPDGKNININCGSEHINRLKTEVQKRNAYFGIAHDGDGDRLIMVDENAQCLNGDQIIGIIANYLKHKGLLKNNIVVVTKQSNCGLDESLEDDGIKVVRTDIGDRNVYYEMVKHRSILGGEESGHIILREYANTGDAISAAMMILKIMSETKCSLSELAKKIRLFPKKMINLRVEKHVPIEQLTDLTRLLQRLKDTNFDYKRSLIRYSGTENKLRIMVEAKTESCASDAVQQIQDCVVKEFEKREIFVK